MEVNNKLNSYDKILNKAIDRNIPFIMQFELTSQCNLNCIHCYNVQENKKRELSTEKIKSILDELADMGTLFMGFTGGEILYREDFFAIAQYARKKSFALRLFTNATLITEEIADKIFDLAPLTVEISLYATNPSIHNKITGVSGSYSKTIDTIDMLNKRRLNIVIKSIIMKENAQEYENLRTFAKNIGARFVFDYVIIPRSDGSKKPLGYCMSDFQMKELICRNIKRGAKKYLERLEELPDKEEVICGGARDGACISSSGDVYPCVTWRINLGNLKERRFKEIWNSPTANEIRNLTIGDIKYCSNCRLFFYCNHCPGMALLDTGDSLGLSPTACHVAKLKKEAMDMASSKWQMAHSL